MDRRLEEERMGIEINAWEIGTSSLLFDFLGRLLVQFSTEFIKPEWITSDRTAPSFPRKTLHWRISVNIPLAITTCLPWRVNATFFSVHPRISLTRFYEILIDPSFFSTINKLSFAREQILLLDYIALAIFRADSTEDFFLSIFEAKTIKLLLIRKYDCRGNLIFRARRETKIKGTCITKYVFRNTF